MKTIELYDDVYMVQFFVVYDCDIDGFYNYIEEMTGERISKDDVKPFNSLFEGMEPGRVIKAFIFLNTDDINLRGIAHEVAHAIIYIFEVRGIPINEANDEAFCWYYDFILNKLYPKVALHGAGY